MVPMNQVKNGLQASWEKHDQLMVKEKGTSACPNGMFYCANKGHIPAYIKSYTVNDGVCGK